MTRSSHCGRVCSGWAALSLVASSSRMTVRLFQNGAHERRSLVATQSNAKQIIRKEHPVECWRRVASTRRYRFSASRLLGVGPWVPKTPAKPSTRTWVRSMAGKLMFRGATGNRWRCGRLLSSQRRAATTQFTCRGFRARSVRVGAVNRGSWWPPAVNRNGYLAGTI